MHHLLRLLFLKQLSIILVVQELLIKHTYEGILVIGDILAHLFLGVAQLLHNSLHHFVINQATTIFIAPLTTIHTWEIIWIRLSSFRLISTLLSCCSLLMLLIWEKLGTGEQFLAIFKPAIIGLVLILVMLLTVFAVTNLHHLLVMLLLLLVWRAPSS